MITLEQTALLFIAIAALVVGYVVFRKDPHHPVNGSFFLFTLGVFSWASGVTLLYITHNFAFDKATLGGGLIMLLGIVLFARVFPALHVIPKRFYFSFIPLLFAFAALPFDLFIRGIQIDADGFVQPINGPLFPFFLAVFLGYSVFAAYLFIRTFIRSRGIARMQAAYLMTGLGIFIVSVALCNAILPFFGIYQFNLVGPLSSIAFIGFTGYAIVRHRLMDIRVVIQRSLIYTVLLTGVIGIYLLLVNAASVLFSGYSKTALFTAALATTIVSTFSIPVIETLFRRLTDRIFFKDTYDYADAMHSVSKILADSTTFEGLVDRLEEALSSILRAKSVTITLTNPGETESEPKQQDHFTLTAYSTIDGNIVARIDVGPKLSGDRYTHKDSQFLETFTHHAATALSRVRLFKEVEEYAQDLEQKVEERTRELRNARDHEQRVMTDLSHNLQTPLTIFQTKLEQLKKKTKDDREIRSLEQSLSELSGFIYTLLSLAQREQEEEATDSEFNLSELLRDLAEEIRIIAGTRGITVQTAIPSGICMRGSEKQIREAIMNLASNAVTYMRSEGTKAIRFTLTETDNEIVIGISDTGVGIPETDLPYVCDRFYRGVTSSRTTKGTGIGLSIVKHIIERHGGTLSITSNTAEGTCVSCTLPRRFT